MAPLRLLVLLVSLHLLAAADLYDEPGGRNDGTLSFSHEPRDLVVARGQSARLDCLVRLAASAPGADDTDRASGLRVIWYQDGEALNLPDARRHLLANGSLYFDKVLHKRPSRSSSDEGVYYCVAQQSTGQGADSGGGGSFVSKNATVRVAVLAKEFAFWPADTTVEASDSVRLGCRIESVPEALVDWEKDGSLVEAGSRFAVLPSGVLHIYNASEEDAGNYRCVARNLLAGKERKSPAGRLSVMPASGEPREPVFISPPASSATSSTGVLWVSDKANVTLECLVAARPAASVRWTLNSTLVLAPDFTSGRLNVRPGFLTLTDIDPSMAGDYTCSATGGANVTLTRTTAIRVATVPEFVQAPQSQVFPTAKTVRFECEASGNPVPDIRWLKDGRPLQIGGRIKNKMVGAGSSQLVLSNTVTQDSGVYQCQAHNRAGLVSAAARLLVNITGRRPEPPSRLRAVPLSASEIVLSWDPPRNVPLDDVTAYTVHYTLVGKGSDETQELALNNSHHVRQLVRNANYSFYVRAYIRKSASDPSERFVFNAAQALAQPPAPPTVGPSRPPSKTLPPPQSGVAAPNVTLQPLNPTTLRVTWSKFPSPVSLYKILFRRHNKKEYDIEVVKGVILEYNITGLHPGRKYDVKVAPGGMNVFGPWVTVEMPPVLNDASTTPPAPSNPLAAPAVELVAVNHTSVLVTWEDRGAATGRQVAQSVVLTCRVQGGRDTSQRMVLPSSGKQWIKGLKSGSVYEFQLVATTGNQEGPATTRTIRTLWETSAGVDNELEEGLDFEQGPVHVEAVVVSSSEIQLNWKPVERGIVYYTVRYLAIPDESLVLLGADKHPRVGYVRSTSTDVLLNNLTAYTLYHISVRSHDRDGRLSAFSSPPVEKWTLPDVPGPPSDVTWLITPEDKIQLTWRQPVLPNGIIISYAILVALDPLAAPDNWTMQEEPGSKFRAQLHNLVPDVQYYVRMQARTSVGWGALTEPMSVQLKSEPEKPPAPTHSTRSDLPAGVIIGLVIALCLSLVVVVSLMLSRRCSKTHSNNSRPSATASSADASMPRSRPAAGVAISNGGVPVNGYPKMARSFGAASTSVEMDAFVPMLATIPGDAPADLDTKGGNPSSIQRSIREAIREEEEDDEGDRSQIPLLTLKDPRADATVLTETTCLSLDVTLDGRRRQDSMQSHDDSSLHSLDDSRGADGEQDDGSEPSSSSRSLRDHDDDDTGICHADHQMNDTDVAGTSSTMSPTLSCTGSLNNNTINNASSRSGNNNNNGRPTVVT